MNMGIQSFPHLVVIATLCMILLPMCSCQRGKYVRSNDLEQIVELISEVRKLAKTQGNSIEDAARLWLTETNEELAEQTNKVAIADWNYETNLTDENAEALTAADVESQEWQKEKIKEAKVFLQDADSFEDQTLTRMLNFFVNVETPIANDLATVKAISDLSNELTSIYGNAQVEKDGQTYNLEPELTELMAKSRDYDTLLWGWKEWRDVTGPFMKDKFTEIVALQNEAARDNGKHDLGECWRIASYEKDNIEKMADKLFKKILPLYKELHAYVRSKLVDVYSAEKVGPDDPLPAHLLGNMWAQQWNNIYDIVVPFPNTPDIDVTGSMESQGYTPTTMFQLGEQFFTSLGLEPMTDVFWEKSMIVRPDDRPVQCHASASDFMKGDDFRIKMCSEVNKEYLQTIHHEMGHIEYFMQYSHQPTLFRNGANAAFHEAIGDTIALSVATPEHLKAIGLYDGDDDDDDVNGKSNSDENCFDSDVACTRSEERDLNYLMSVALEKIAFLPFGYLIDKWRWNVFNGKIDENHYNSAWWEYRVKYQGIAPPVERTENDFDPGAKFHVPAFVPYIRYFLSFIGQFQFQKALCDKKGYIGPLHHCDIYQSTKAGDLLKSVLSEGCSKPWPDTLEKFTGSREFEVDAIYEYFDPLYKWLRKQNKGHPVGW